MTSISKKIESEKENQSFSKIIDLIESERNRLIRRFDSLFQEVTILKEGMSFGELALNSGVPRAATILCKTDCHFAVMSKADYEKCLLNTAKKNM